MASGPTVIFLSELNNMLEFFRSRKFEMQLNTDTYTLDNFNIQWRRGENNHIWTRFVTNLF